MNTTIYEILSKKTSKDLKNYIINMSDGYKKEAVEAAIEILRERGERIDDLLETAQVKFCSLCKHRQVSKDGLICGITNQKADFICSCPSYLSDEVELKEQERMKNEESGWGGMMKFYLVFLGISSLFTILLALFHFINSKGSIFTALSDFILSFGYSVLCIYTIIAFSKRLPNAVTLGKIQNYALIVITSLVYIFKILGESDASWHNGLTRLISSFIWSAIFLGYLYGNEQINAVFPKESRHLLKYDKLGILSTLGIVLVLYVASVSELVFKEANKSVNDLKTYVEQCQKFLSIDENAEFYCCGVEVKDGSVVISYHSTIYNNSELEPEFLEYFQVFSKELLFFYPQNFDSVLMDKCYMADYGMSICWYDNNDEYSFSMNYSPEEVNAICEDSIHHTSHEAWADFLCGWNKHLPIDYIGKTLYYSADVKEDTAIVKLTLKDVTASDLKHMTNKYLKAYLNDNLGNLSDQFITLAMINRMNLCFIFNSNVSSSWNESIFFSPDEYQFRN